MWLCVSTVPRISFSFLLFVVVVLIDALDVLNQYLCTLFEGADEALFCCCALFCLLILEMLKPMEDPAGLADGVDLTIPWIIYSFRGDYFFGNSFFFPHLKQAVKDYAFRNNNYPVILSLENHCSIPQQQKMAE